MRNLYPGICKVCREPVLANAGNYDPESREVRCVRCSLARERVPAKPKILARASGMNVAFSPESFLGGDLFNKYRAASSGARFEPSDKTNIAPMDKALGIIAALGAAGFRDAQDRTYEKNSRVPAPSKRPESEVLRDIENVYSQLSPENLTCDGELPRGQVLRRARQLKLRLRGLFTELGREVSESEAYEALRPR
jgi:hypothetical protein